jgi:uncharacterized protein YuzE
MTISYDSEVDALYIRFIETTVTTEHLAEGIAVDYAADGRMAGIEILDARNASAAPRCSAASCWKTWPSANLLLDFGFSVVPNP